MVMQGPLMVKSAVVSIEHPPYFKEAGEQDVQPFDLDKLESFFHVFNLSMEECPYVVQWPHEAPVARVIDELRTLIASIKIGFHADAVTVDKPGRPRGQGAAQLRRSLAELYVPGVHVRRAEEGRQQGRRAEGYPLPSHSR